MSFEKGIIRKKYLLRRKSLSEAEIQRLSNSIFLQFRKWLELNPEVKNFHIFLPISRQNEINTYLIRDLLFAEQRSVYTSIVKPDLLVMDTVRIYPETTYKFDSLGIPTPINPEVVNTEEIQLVLVPLVAFDLNGNRIGFGKGYYDKFLAEMKQKVIKMGLSFFPPIPSITSEKHDIPLDYCITGENVFNF